MHKVRILGAKLVREAMVAAVWSVTFGGLILLSYHAPQDEASWHTALALMLPAIAILVTLQLHHRAGAKKHEPSVVSSASDAPALRIETRRGRGRL